ncbi:putative membrane protein [Endobacter medicaginis]|jgi:uncharacterized membrane protein|uniref:CopD family protein n=1 Tax=Endobacter medicaginis TaxID=1181271 RepID=A0A839UTA7_9PROT|nr:CopD family protein [Endobacter medicaginis]MBB3173488.1 putative membrane protein [Endobacter medicaginis]MCX5475477.1 CopD family protein [Endobacter medicaginis]NVN31869.1 CopD family protein [Endobacter medicaginis]
MPAASTLWGLVLAIHLLGMAVWVGGMAYALFVLRPSLGLLDATPRISVHLQSLHRFFRIVWHAMPMVLISGWAMLYGVYGAAANAEWHIQAMQGLGIVMAAVFAYIFFGPYRSLRRAIRPAPATLEKVRRLVSVNLLLGVIVVTIAALGHAFPVAG